MAALALCETVSELFCVMDEEEEEERRIKLGKGPLKSCSTYIEIYLLSITRIVLYISVRAN